MQHVHLKPPSNRTAEAGGDRCSLCSPTPAHSRDTQSCCSDIAHFGSRPSEDGDSAAPWACCSASLLENVRFKWNLPHFSLSPLPHLVTGHHGDCLWAPCCPHQMLTRMDQISSPKPGRSTAGKGPPCLTGLLAQPPGLCSPAHLPSQSFSSSWQHTSSGRGPQPQAPPSLLSLQLTGL